MAVAGREMVDMGAVVSSIQWVSGCQVRAWRRLDAL